MPSNSSLYLERREGNDICFIRREVMPRVGFIVERKVRTEVFTNLMTGGPLTLEQFREFVVASGWSEDPHESKKVAWLVWEDLR